MIMPSYLPDVAVNFRDLYARVEYVLRRSGYSRKDRKKAEVNWTKFAMEMDKPFFLYVQEQKRADTLIKEPPRAYYGARLRHNRRREPCRSSRGSTSIPD
jgi:hypothetical protein